MKKFVKAFTLMELMIVTVVLGVIAAYAIVNYRQTVLQSRMNDAAAAVRTMHGAAIIYEAQNGVFFASPGWLSIDSFNTEHRTNIQEYPNLAYFYTTGGSPAGGFLVGALWDDGGPEEFRLEMEGTPDDGTNLCCHHGTCSGLPGFPVCS